MNISQEVVEIFWSHVSRETSGCWIWTGPRNSRRWLGLWVNRTFYNPKKLAYVILGRDEPYGGIAQNTCGNLLCVNPDHVLYQTEQKRFWEQVDISGKHDCWIYKGGLNNKGYGVFYMAGSRPIGAHIYSYKFAYGKVPKGLEVIHICDNPRCVNFLHLQVATHRKNMEDMSSKGRASHGEGHFSAKLTQVEVCQIRQMFATGEFTKVELGRRFHVSASSIGAIVRRENWRLATCE